MSTHAILEQALKKYNGKIYKTYDAKSFAVSIPNPEIDIYISQCPETNKWKLEHSPQKSTFQHDNLETAIELYINELTPIHCPICNKELPKMLPSKTIESDFNYFSKMTEHHHDDGDKVCKSGAGYYIGSWCTNYYNDNGKLATYQQPNGRSTGYMYKEDAEELFKKWNKQ